MHVEFANAVSGRSVVGTRLFFLKICIDGCCVSQEQCRQCVVSGFVCNSSYVCRSCCVVLVGEWLCE